MRCCFPSAIGLGYFDSVNLGGVRANEKNAERLRLIDEEKEFSMCGITGKLLGIELSNKDYSFLYAEAERAQKLEYELHPCNATKVGIGSIERYTKDIKDENKRLREAIKQSLKKHKWNNEESARILEQVLEVLE